MARTHRDRLNHQRRVKRRSWNIDVFLATLPGQDYDYSDPINRYPRLRGGNMVMAPSTSGIWSDERFQGGRDRDAQRRNQKRGERQRWRREVEQELLAEAALIAAEDEAHAQAAAEDFDARQRAYYDEWIEWDLEMWEQDLDIPADL